MLFSAAEITSARRLREAGLPWKPAAGHYVYDETGFCKQPSPFQDQVYYILNYDYFMKAVGGVERFKQIMLWLPTWHDARSLLRGYGVSDQQIADYLNERQAIATGTELLALYQRIETVLSGQQTAAPGEAMRPDAGIE